MKNNNNDNDLTKSVNNEDNQMDSLDKMAETEPAASPNDPETQESDHPEGDAGSAADGLKEDQPANNPNVESETVTEEIQPQEPLTESLTYMGMDSTAMIDIAFVETEDENDNSVADWINKVAKPKDGQELDKESVIQECIALIEGSIAEANKLINIAAKNYADRAIDIGTACIFLKELTRGFDDPWGVWAEKNLPFLGKRNRQKFMKIANRTDCHDFTYLGVDRLDVLCSLTKDSEEKEPVRALLEKYSIPFDETSEVNMTEFRNKVDAAISNERLLKKGLKIDFDLVANAINAKVGIDKGLIKKLKDIQDCEGNPETHLRTLTLGQGSDDPETEVKKRFQDFNSLSSRLVKTIDYIIRNRDHLDSLDKDIFTYLYGKIEELREASNIVIEEEPEA
jgi:hypothetical protein